MSTVVDFVPTEEYVVLPMFSHHGPTSLDAIATEYYGKQYKGQQTGDMLSNDTWQVYDMSTEDKCLDYDIEECYKPLQRWLDMKIGDVIEDTDSWPYREKTVKYDFDIYREAPLPAYVLADLVRNHKLPYGKYLVQVMW